ncbi:MAG: DNA polymerase III subunit delta' [Aestuariivita sp.]|nr:DNA polymerase III subunit delta' [Aestuariivita sp.]
MAKLNQSGNFHPHPDVVPDIPHPCETLCVIGQTEAENEFLKAFNFERLHHAWILAGLKGIGKATLAYRIARFLLVTPTSLTTNIFSEKNLISTLNIDPNNLVFGRILAGSEPGLKVIKRSATDTGTLSNVIRVDDIRKLHSFFGLKSANDEHRIVIIDSADEMNSEAANALLKLLEEPPLGAVLLLISHQPSRLLPTIRSRCRTLNCKQLSATDMIKALEQTGAKSIDLTSAQALVELSSGSVGTAFRLLNNNGLTLYADLINLLCTLPKFLPNDALALAKTVTGSKNNERIDLLFFIIDFVLTRLARYGAMGTTATDAAPNEIEILRGLAPDTRAARIWANTALSVNARARRGLQVNLDPSTLVLDAIFSIVQSAKQINQKPFVSTIN